MLEKTFYKTLLSRSFKNVPVKVVFLGSLHGNLRGWGSGNYNYL